MKTNSGCCGGGRFAIRLGHNDLMNSRLSASEEALATAVCPRLGPRPRILIGGLGMGFTLRAALGVLGMEARVVVAELVPEIVAWARGPMAELFGTRLDRIPRVTIVETDVSDAITGEAVGIRRNSSRCRQRPRWPHAQGQRSDLRPPGTCRSTLRLGSRWVLAVWSSGPDAAFSARLRRSGFEVDEIKVRAHRGRSGAKHVIWIATRPGR